ncbi:MAG: hypothetical protein ACFCGT_16595 [Sandaracinaceae bacterium]
MDVAETLILGAQVYLAVGGLVALPFLVVGLRRVEGGRGASIPFRVLILPSVVALWPAVVWRWIVGPTQAERAS